jgi:hypothetical protein
LHVPELKLGHIQRNNSSCFNNLPKHATRSPNLQPKLHVPLAEPATILCLTPRSAKIFFSHTFLHRPSRQAAQRPFLMLTADLARPPVAPILAA